ncbi:MAG TPA: type II restriction endonuclease [Ktedonobacteraceae bacterium]|nr:type II restriction endonuclease [Ktedonobacteraceae bacterium]
MKITNLKQFALSKNIRLKEQKEIAQIASDNMAKRFSYNREQIKKNFDSLISETGIETYRVYLEFEKKYGQEVFKAFAQNLIETKELSDNTRLGEILGGYFVVFDKFFLSLAQARRTRAGKSFEAIHNALFKELEYPFDEQRVINGKPDFIMPSFEHFKQNPIDCIIFTAKRTLRERWRQIVTEGTRGLGFYLATIDEKLTAPQLDEMHRNRIYIVCPQSIKEANYRDKVNVLSFTQFFKDYLDPAMERWRRNHVI